MNQPAKDRGELFSTAKTFPLIVKFSIPTIIGMLVNALYQIVDRAFVGNIPGGEGELGIAAITVCTPLTIIVFSIAMLAGAGGGANISLNLGRGDKELAEKFIGTGFTMGIIGSLAVTAVVLIFQNPILKLFGASEAVLPYAKTYLSIVMGFSVINTGAFSLNRYLLSQGFPTISMRTNMVGVIVNSILDPLFIFVFGWGIAGAAIATVIAQAASFSWVLYCCLAKKTPLRLKLSDMHPSRPVVLSIAALGSSPFILQLAISLVQFVFNNRLADFGDTAIASMGVVSAVSQILLMPVYGINQGVQPIIGYNYGAKLYHRVKKLLIQSILTATAVMSTFWLIVMLFAKSVVRIFGSDNLQLLQTAPLAIRLFMAALPLVGFQVVSSNYFQATGKPKQALMLSTSRQVLFLIPAVLLLPMWFGMNGIFAAGMTADLLSSVLTSLFFYFELRALTKLQHS